MSGTNRDDHVAEELRLLALGLLDRAEPGLRALLARMREQPRPSGHSRTQEPPRTPEQPAACTRCPVCAVAGLLRGEHPELAAAIGHHADGLLTALRAVLTGSDEDADASTSTDTTPGGGTARRVQRIELRADGGC